MIVVVAGNKGWGMLIPKRHTARIACNGNKWYFFSSKETDETLPTVSDNNICSFINHFALITTQLLWIISRWNSVCF